MDCGLRSTDYGLVIKNSDWVRIKFQQNWANYLQIREKQDQTSRFMLPVIHKVFTSFLLFQSYLVRFLAPFFSPQSTVSVCCIFYTERLPRKGWREGYERLADSVLKMAAPVTCGFRDYMVGELQRNYRYCVSRV